jgi:hypothetical protein
VGAVRDAFGNTGNRRRANVLLSIHSSDPAEQEALDKYIYLNPGRTINLNDFVAVVPEGMMVVLFTPPNCLALTNDDEEKALRELLSDPEWYKHKTEFVRNIARHDIAIAEYITSVTKRPKVFYPGQFLYNQLMSFDNAQTYYDLFTLDPSGGEPYNSMRTPLKWKLAGARGASSALKRETTIAAHDPRHRVVPARKAAKSALGAHHAQVKFDDFTTEQVLQKIKEPRTRAAPAPLRIVYILSCSPVMDVLALKTGVKELLAGDNPTDRALRAAERGGNQMVAPIAAEITKIRARIDEEGVLRWTALMNELGVRRGPQRAAAAASGARSNAVSYATENEGERELYKRWQEMLGKQHGVYRRRNDNLYYPCLSPCNRQGCKGFVTDENERIGDPYTLMQCGYLPGGGRRKGGRRRKTRGGRKGRKTRRRKGRKTRRRRKGRKTRRRRKGRKGSKKH